jgi:serine/threonine protein phosphatase PrpC
MYGFRRAFRNASKLIPVLLTAQVFSVHQVQLTDCARFSSGSYPANNPTEDRYLHGNTPNWSVGAVFDGHGGWQVSDYVSRNLVDKVLDRISAIPEGDEITLDAAITEAFESMEQDVVDKIRPAFNLGFGEVAKVGSCVLLALKKGNRLVVANCGDCRAILGSSVSEKEKLAPSLTVSNPVSAPEQENNHGGFFRNLWFAKPAAGQKGGEGSSSGTGSNSPSTGTGTDIGVTVPEFERLKYASTRINRDHNARVVLEQLRLEQDHEGEAGLYRCKSARACYVKGRLQLTRSLGDEYLKRAEFNGSKEGHRSG